MVLSSLEPELLPIEVLHYGTSEYRTFCSYDLDLEWPDDLYKQIWPVSPEDVPAEKKNELSTLNLSIILRTDRQTYRLMPPKHYHASSRVEKSRDDAPDPY